MANKKRKRKHPAPLNIHDIPFAKPVLNIVDAPPMERQPSRGATIRPVVHGGYRNAFQTVPMAGYCYTIYGEGAK